MRITGITGPIVRPGPKAPLAVLREQLLDSVLAAIDQRRQAIVDLEREITTATVLLTIRQYLDFAPVPR